jgi:uncharacterized small protein (DUF1192 family)
VQSTPDHRKAGQGEPLDLEAIRAEWPTALGHPAVPVIHALLDQLGACRRQHMMQQTSSDYELGQQHAEAASAAEIERLRAELEQATDQAEARGIEAHAAGDFITTLTEDLESARAELSKRDSTRDPRS